MRTQESEGFGGSDCKSTNEAVLNEATSILQRLRRSILAVHRPGCCVQGSWMVGRCSCFLIISLDLHFCGSPWNLGTWLSVNILVTPGTCPNGSEEGGGKFLMRLEARDPSKVASSLTSAAAKPR